MMIFACVVMFVTFGMALYFMIKGYINETSTKDITIEDENIDELVNSVPQIVISDEEELNIIADSLESIVSDISNEVEMINSICYNEKEKVPTILNEVMEITNSVEPEVEYTNGDYHIIDTSLSYKIEGDSDRELMNHIIKGAFTTSEGAGKDYNTMNVHLVIVNKTTKEEVVNVIQSYYNVVSPNSEYYFGFNEITDYNEDEYTFRCSITGYYDNKDHKNNISFKAKVRK